MTLQTQCWCMKDASAVLKVFISSIHNRKSANWKLFLWLCFNWRKNTKDQPLSLLSGLLSTGCPEGTWWCCSCSAAANRKSSYSWVTQTKQTRQSLNKRLMFHSLLNNSKFGSLPGSWRALTALWWKQQTWWRRSRCHHHLCHPWTGSFPQTSAWTERTAPRFPHALQHRKHFKH